MPELPEVEMVRRSLLPHIVGKTVQTVAALHPKPIALTPEIVSVLPTHTITNVKRRAKLVIITTDNSNINVVVHLKMTGQLLFLKAGNMSGGGHTLTKTDLQLPHRHTRVTITFTDGSHLYFNDMRLFGYVRLLSATQLQAATAEYGIEPGLDNFTLEAFLQIFTGKKTNLKALLLNQSLIAGLGNIYVDEACFYAKVRPTKKVQTLTKKQKQELFEGCKKVIQDAINNGGTTFYSFKDGNGTAGNYIDQLKVFSKEGTPCARCGTKIKKIKHAGRGTHFCPSCQK